MNNDEFLRKAERRADSLLRAIERYPQYKQTVLRSTELKTLDRFKAGEPVTITLRGVLDGLVSLDEGGVIQGTLADPQRGLIDVIRNTTGASAITGKRIGLAVDVTEIAPTGEEMTLTHHGYVAGNQKAAYYIVEADGDILHPAATYGRVAIAGTVLFDFITPIENL